MIAGLAEDTILSVILKQQAKLMTCMPCKITQVMDDGVQAKVDVQPLVNVLYQDDTGQERGQILGVPIVYPASKTSMVSFPINVGDIVLCVMASRSIDNFKSGIGEPQTPTDNRRMSARDAIAIPGLFPFATNPVNPALRKFPHDTRDMVMAHNLGSGTEVEIRLTPAGKIIINTEFEGLEVNAKTATLNITEKISINAPDMDVNVGNTNWNGNIKHTGNLDHQGSTTQKGDYTQTGNYTLTGVAKFNGIVFDTHVHSGVMSGPSTTGPVAG